MNDIVAVEWLPLAAAVKRLSDPVEKVFLTNVGRHAIRRRRARAQRQGAGRQGSATAGKINPSNG
jgi:hypothetical protein